MTNAMYAFSGDPITNGHTNIVQRAAALFDNVLVGIGKNPQKNYTFTLEERTEMAKKSLAHLPNVSVTSFKGMLVDFAYEQCVPVIIKSFRDQKDIDYETALHEIQRSQNLGIETLLLFSNPDQKHISSTAVKSIQKEQGSLRGYVNIFVKQKLEERISGQYVLGVTGVVGAGKSYVGKRFVDLGLQQGIPVHNIELDDIGHEIIGGLEEPRYRKIREGIVGRYGSDILSEQGHIDRKKLSKIVFDNPDELKNLDKVMGQAVLVRVRREMYGKKGIIILNSALLAETNATYLCNNNVVVVDVDEHTQLRRMQARGYSEHHIDRLRSSQYVSGDKLTKIQDQIDNDGHGKIWHIENPDLSTTYVDLFERIVDELRVR